MRSSDEDEELRNFELVDPMPSSRLRDVVKVLETKTPSVVTLDALIPPREAGEAVLQTLFHKMNASVKVLSLRFNNLSPASIEHVIEWVKHNERLEMLYVHGSGFDDKTRPRLEDAWRKHLLNHRLDNMGLTFIRITQDKMPKPEDDAK
jgi:DNA repair photolyase